MAKLKKIIAKNRRAKYDYSLEEFFVAGIQLEGHEVKSVRTGNVDLKGSYVTTSDNEAWALNIFIKPYDHASNLEDYDPTRTRKLLLTKKEIETLSKAKKNGYTLVITAIGLVRKFIKVELAIAKGKKKYDKRQTIKKRDLDREIKKR